MILGMDNCSKMFPHSHHAVGKRLSLQEQQGQGVGMGLKMITC